MGARIAQDFLIANFDAVYDKFTKMDEFTFPGILSGAFGFITTTEELDKVKCFQCFFSIVIMDYYWAISRREFFQTRLDSRQRCNTSSTSVFKNILLFYVHLFKHL